MSVTIYASDHGTLALTPKDLRKATGFAEGVQHACWRRHGDEMIGVPEVEVYCNATTEEWEARIKAEYERHGRFWS